MKIFSAITGICQGLAVILFIIFGCFGMWFADHLPEERAVRTALFCVALIPGILLVICGARDSEKGIKILSITVAISYILLLFTFAVLEYFGIWFNELFSKYLVIKILALAIPFVTGVLLSTFGIQSIEANRNAQAFSGSGKKAQASSGSDSDSGKKRENVERPDSPSISVREYRRIADDTILFILTADQLPQEDLMVGVNTRVINDYEDKAPKPEKFSAYFARGNRQSFPFPVTVNANSTTIVGVTPHDEYYVDPDSLPKRIPAFDRIVVSNEDPVFRAYELGKNNKLVLNN